jgi:type 1 glutamine amidotransferase
VAIAALSCQHETIVPEHQVSFASDILPILQSNCAFSGCHDTLGHGERPLNTYDDVTHGDYVVPGKPHESEIFQRVSMTTGEDMMPQAPYPHLTDRNLRLIYIWIAQGANNN